MRIQMDFLGNIMKLYALDSYICDIRPIRILIKALLGIIHNFPKEFGEYTCPTSNPLLS